MRQTPTRRVLGHCVSSVDYRCQKYNDLAHQTALLLSVCVDHRVQPQGSRSSFSDTPNISRDYIPGCPQRKTHLSKGVTCLRNTLNFSKKCSDWLVVLSSCFTASPPLLPPPAALQVTGASRTSQGSPRGCSRSTCASSSSTTGASTSAPEPARCGRS